MSDLFVQPNNFIGPHPRGYFSFRTLVRQIVTSGSTPHLALIKKYVWILIALVVVPPLLHDIFDYLTPPTPAEKLDRDREQRRLLYKLRHAIGGWKIRQVPEGEVGTSADAVRKFVGAFRADFEAHWEGDGRVRARKTGLQAKRVTSKHIEESLSDVIAFDRKSDDAVAGALILADALHDEVRVACQATVEAKDMKYADGQELNARLARCKWCLGILAGFRGSAWRPRSKLESAERREVVRLAMAAVRARYNEAAAARRKIASEDRWKVVKLLLLGRTHFPYIIVQIFFNIVSGSIQTMHRWQNAEVINFFTERTNTTGAVSLDGFGDLLYGIIVTRILGIALSKTSNHLEKHGTLKMSIALRKALFSKMMCQDMEHFEEKFKRKDQARVMLNNYLSQKVMSRVDRVLWRIRDMSRIISSVLMLRARNPRLLLIMLGVLPFRLAFGETTNWISTRLQQIQSDTENFDMTELMGTLDSRSSFAATRLTGREKVQKERYAVVMERWQRNQLKMRTVSQLSTPVINSMRTFSQMAGYYWGAFMVADGLMTPADLVTFIDEAQSLVNSVRMWIMTWTQIFYDRRDPILLARFNAVVPAIGLTGGRPDGFKYIIPKTPPSEFIWQLECKDVTFWYPADPEQKKIFSGLNMVIPHGHTVGICGQTGCGKSTLLRLLTRLYDIQGGTILLNGRDLRDYEPQWLRENVSFVTSVKDTYLFSTTVSRNLQREPSWPCPDRPAPASARQVRENIEFGIGSGIDPDMEEEERIKLVEAAATQAQLMHTVNSMPNGLNTMIGDRSEENLSDGQTQRLSLARGFLKDSEMMMLDEPTSALDPVVEQRIVDAIRQRLARGGRTRTGIIVAHRISTIMSCDTILFLERVRTPSYFWLRLWLQLQLRLGFELVHVAPTE